MTDVNGMTGTELSDKLAEAVSPLSERVLEMTTAEKIAYSSKLCLPWQKPMLMLLEAYVKEYPPTTTSKEVMQAVSVQLPLRAFIALMSAAQCVIISAHENDPQGVA